MAGLNDLRDFSCLNDSVIPKRGLPVGGRERKRHWLNVTSPKILVTKQKQHKLYQIHLDHCIKKNKIKKLKFLLIYKMHLTVSLYNC